MTGQLSDELWLALTTIINEIDAGRLGGDWKKGYFNKNELTFNKTWGFQMRFFSKDTRTMVDALERAGMIKKDTNYSLTIGTPTYEVTDAARQAARLHNEQALARIKAQTLDDVDWERPAAAGESAAPPTSAAELARFIDQWFDREDLQNLCFDLGVDYHNLAGEKKETKARNLVQHMTNRGRLPALEQKLAAERPEQYKTLGRD